MYDLIIRGGTIIDGSGDEPFVGDIAVLDGKIAKLGAVDGRATEEIDARELVVTPGFVDIHTHYDGQAIWSDRLVPSSADINVIDYDALRLESPAVSCDLPGGGRRLLQGAQGFVATIVSGTPIQRDDRPTGALPGRLVRSRQAEPRIA